MLTAKRTWLAGVAALALMACSQEQTTQAEATAATTATTTDTVDILEETQDMTTESARAEAEAEPAQDMADQSSQALQAAAETEPSNDPYLFLEEVEGETALNTVRSWNDATLEKLTADSRFDEFQSEALAILNAEDKIAYGQYRGGHVYNFWQDAEHVRGVLRRTSLESYASQGPSDWETLISIDALAEEEGQNWVYKGSTCRPPAYTQCLLSLSDGGKDATTYREWNHDTASFVEGGFSLPEAKSGVTWAGADSLLVATDWGEGSLTESGYPFIIKRLERGQPLDEAVEVLRGSPEDVGLGGFRLETDDPDAPVMMAINSHTFYERTYYWLSEEGPKALPIPRKSSINEYFKGQLVLSLEEDWSPIEGGDTFAKGTIVSFDLNQWMESGEVGDIAVLYAPGERSSVEGVSATQSKIILVVYENVIGKAYSVDFVDGDWTREPLALPDKGSLGAISAYGDSDTAFINQESHIAPDTLWRVDMASGDASVIKATPARFDAENMRVEQFEAASSDGEKIPYFVIHPADMPLDGSNPTLLYGYGGFQISLNPSYSGTVGKLWLENGGVYVIANIRGGGEFGPKWHQAGLKTNRQIIYDDFIAVAEDLIARGITSSERLGISGGSNGGLLVGAAYTQRPDLFNAVVCAVPLLDMLRYHMLLAGASWMGEYGDPDIPEERAFLESISPYHNVNADEDYPNILFLTSTKDDRVHPGHARKMAALLAEYGHPFEYYENIDGGHSAAANLQETAKRLALQYTFLAQNLMDKAPE